MGGDNESLTLLWREMQSLELSGRYLLVAVTWRSSSLRFNPTTVSIGATSALKYEEMTVLRTSRSKVEADVYRSWEVR